jgi:DNA-binding MarR family transcriptional regulator
LNSGLCPIIPHGREFPRGARSADDEYDVGVAKLRDKDYEKLLDLQTGLRRFLRWSEDQALAEGLTGAQQELLLAVRGHPDRRGPTIGEVSRYLMRRSHTTVSLVDRAVAAGLLERRADREDQRVVRLALTASGNRHLDRLAGLYREQLARLGPRASGLWRGLDAQG